MLLCALVQYLVFKEGADIHIFWPHYFAPYFALAMGALSASAGELTVWMGDRLGTGLTRHRAASAAAPWVALALLGAPTVFILKDGLSLVRRHLDRKMPWRLVKKYCRAAGIDPDRLGARGVGVHSLRKTAINDAIRNGAQMHEVREFAGHSDIRTTELYFVRKEEDGEVAARRIQIRVTGRTKD